VNEHLSVLQLDEVAAGLSPAPEHLATCAKCAAELAALRAQSAAFLARPEAKQQLANLAPAPPRRNLVPFVVLAAAAAMALFFAVPRAGNEDRIKGAPSVVLLDEAGNVVTHAAPGSRLTLAVGGAGFPRVEVFAVDAEGKKEPLYSGVVAAGARVPLTQLEVTPGDVTVTAVFEREAQQQSVSVKLAVP
jgi:anti-sigma factor RsiW